MNNYKESLVLRKTSMPIFLNEQYFLPKYPEKLLVFLRIMKGLYQRGSICPDLSHISRNGLLNFPFENGGVFMQQNLNEAGITGAIPLSEKYMLSIREAACYFNIGVKKMRRLAEENMGRFSVFSGNRYLINRTKFEQFLNETSAI